jgi:hypothetical protein
MKAEHVKTPETTEEVSSHGVEKRAERHKCQRRTPFAREKRRADWKSDLQVCGAGRKSRKRLTLVVGKKPNGKSQPRWNFLIMFCPSHEINEYATLLKA